MNPLTNTRNICKLNEDELKAGIFDHKISWHSDYSHSAYIFLIGGLPYELTEGDIICVFSQYGEIVNIHLVRDQKTGKSKGFGFVAYEDQRSTILAVDNLNSIKLGGRTIRVDHVSDFKPPKSGEKDKFGNRLLLTPRNCSRGAPTTSNETESNTSKTASRSDRNRERMRSRSRSNDKYRKSSPRRSNHSRSKYYDRRRSRDRH